MNAPIKDLFSIEKNREYLQELAKNRKNLVPFIGSGFSFPFCPFLGQFLWGCFQRLKNDGLLLPEEIEEFELIESGDQPHRLERGEKFLFDKSPKHFKEELKRQMETTVPIDKVKKFHLLHRAFPYLKITANYDRLIETTVPHGVYTEVAYGYQEDELDRLFVLRNEKNCLLKIHGGIEDMKSIVLSPLQLRKLYGHEQSYDPNAELPYFLKRVFTSAPVLFIGCSMRRDRLTMIMEDLREMPSHYALMKLPDTGRDKILLKRRLSNQGISIIWVEEYNQIEEILAYLADKPEGAEVSWPSLGPFVGRVKELDTIGKNLEFGGVQAITGRLYSIDGAGGVGKTTLAIEAARRFKDRFIDGVLPLFRGDDLTPVSFAMALAAYFNIKLTEPQDVESAWQAATGILQNRRCLLILDNVEKWEDLRYMIPLRTTATILVTTRNRDIYQRIRNHFPELYVEEIALEKFTPKESLDLFQQVLGPEYRDRDKDIYLEMARDLGFLPLALRQAAALMAYTPHYRPADLRDKLKGESRLELLRQGSAEAESDTRVIEAVFDLYSPLLTPELKETLEMLAICSSGPVPLDFLERLAKDKKPGLEERLEILHTYSWCDRREKDAERYYELHHLVRELVRAQGRKDKQGVLLYLEDFIAVVHDIFMDDTVHFSVKERYYFQLEEAFAAAVQRKDPRLKDWLYSLYYFCTYRGYTNFYLRLTEAVERFFPGDQWAIRTVYGNRALILQDWGKLAEAMDCHKKQEKISEQLGDLDGLARSYGNQALILKTWGQLMEAMTLHKKEEKIKEELGDRAGLAICYGNQALILKAWGRLEEAMACLQKQLKLSEELGDRAGLSRSYGNQALILSEWGRLEEAMACLQKQLKLSEELGDRAGLARSYGNQALIFSEWGRLEEVVTLQKKQEAIFEELGDRAGLAICWWNQGTIAGHRGDPHAQTLLWKKSLETNKALDIPTGNYEKALKELLEKSART
jgi:tetratricopeptide (TPR) repeat protein